MKAFEFEYTIEIWNRVVITAETEAEAREKFLDGDYDEPEVSGSEMTEIEMTELDIDEDLP